jgi:hypothetical protein
MTKPSGCFPLFSLLVFISLMVTLSSLLISSTDYVDAAYFGVPLSGDSDYRKTIAWGKTLPFIVDNPYNSGAQSIDSKDVFRIGYFIYSWLTWFVAVVTSYVTVAVSISMLKKLRRH